MNEIIKSATISGVSRVNYSDSKRREKQNLSGRTVNEGDSQATLDPSFDPKDSFVISSSMEDVDDLSDTLSLEFQDAVHKLNEKISQLTSLLEAKNQENIVLKAEIESLNKASSEEIDSEKNIAYQKGIELADGYIKEKIADEKAALRLAADKLCSWINQKYEESDKTIVDIAFALFIKIYGQNFQSKDAIVSQLNKALIDLRVGRSATIHVSADDYEILMAEQIELNKLLPVDQVTLNKDSRVVNGGCIIESIRGTWDARIETQLQRLRESLALNLSI